MAIVPADAEARRLLLKHLLDHAPAAGLGDSLRLDQDQVPRACALMLDHLLQRDSKPDSNSAIIPTKGGSGVATSDLTRLLDEAGVPYELLSHAHTESAAAQAEALGLAATDVAKTLVVKTPAGYVRAVLSASERLDLRKLRAFLGVGRHDVRLATEDDLRRDFPEFQLGAAPPVGGDRRDPVVIESRLVGRESLVLEAGSHNESIRIATDDLVRIADAQHADICEN